MKPGRYSCAVVEHHTAVDISVPKRKINETINSELTKIFVIALKHLKSILLCGNSARFSNGMPGDDNGRGPLVIFDLIISSVKWQKIAE